MAQRLQMEFLELKEATPSIAPSIYESVLYRSKWRVIFAVIIGVVLLSACVVGFYLNAQARQGASRDLIRARGTTPLPSRRRGDPWRGREGGKCLQESECNAGFTDPPVLVLAIGGLRPDQVDPKSTPAMHEISRCGISAPFVTPVFPAQTLPNLYTIVTGLYPESHGIIADKIFDPVLNANFSLDDSSYIDTDWWRGEPIWVTAANQGKKSATYLWPGADVKIRGKYPTYVHNNKDVHVNNKIKTVIDWLLKPASTRPQLIMMYFDELQKLARKWGPLSVEAKKSLKEVDSQIDNLMIGLHNNGMLACLSIIVLSEAGMTPAACSNTLVLSDYLAGYQFSPTRLHTGSTVRFNVGNGNDPKELDRILELLQCKEPNLRVVDKLQMPKRYHYTNNVRIEDVLVEPKTGYRVSLDGSGRCNLHGENGYNNIDYNMQGSFYALGPNLKSEYKSEGFSVIQIYNFLCQLLNLEPDSNNGTRHSLSYLMENDNKVSFKPDEQKYLLEKLHGEPQRTDESTKQKNLNEFECKCQRGMVKTTTTTTTPSTTSTTSTSTTTSTTTTSTITMPPTTSTKESTTEKRIKTGNKRNATNSSNDENIDFANGKSDSNGEVNEEYQTTIKLMDSHNHVSKIDNENNSAEINVTDDTVVNAKIINASSDVRNRKKKRAANERLVSKEDNGPYLKRLLKRHCPWGSIKYYAPEIATDMLNVLLHTNYSLGVPDFLNIGIWVSYTITDKEQLNELMEYIAYFPEDVNVNKKDIIQKQPPKGCWTFDERLTRSSSDQCQRSQVEQFRKSPGVTLRQLFPEELESPSILASEGFLVSNLSPLRNGFLNGGRRVMLRAIQAWAMKRGPLNIVHGPVFDFDLNGLKDDVTHIRNTRKPIISSNYFYVVTSCNSSENLRSLLDCKPRDISTQAFVFPNTDKDDKCTMGDSEYLSYHSCSILDIQLLTGLKFFVGLESKEVVRMIGKQQIHVWDL